MKEIWLLVALSGRLHSCVEWQSFVVIGLILGAAVASMELGISVAILEILAGVIAVNVVGVQEMPWMEFLANFGLLGLMFFAGFEMELPVLKKHWKPSLSIAFASFVLPFTAISLLSFWLLGVNTQQALLLGIGLATTSVTLMYAVFRERSLLDREQMQVLLTGAKVIDITGVLLLQFIIEGFSFRSWVTLALALFSLPLLPRLGEWLFSRYHGDAIELKMRYVLLVLLGLAFFAETIGVHDALMAFLAGVVFSKLIEDQSDLESKLGGIIFGFLAPVFFFQAGQSLDFSLLSVGGFLVILLFSVVTYGVKYAATFVTARHYFSPGFSQFAAITFNFQFSFGAVVAILALQAGMLDQRLYTVLLSSALVTSLAAAIALRLREARRAREKLENSAVDCSR